MARQTNITEYTSIDDRLSMIFMALADPTRRGILELLRKGDASVNELAKAFPLSLPAISKHLKVLERAGLISRGRNAQWRPCRLEAGTLKEGADWMNQYRQLWEESLGNLENYVQELQSHERTKEGDVQ
ncbi:MAG: winged helix-turn-helix transcriptional regulator [Ktedonobacteraceae bacterium]|nr:winged helix-turn-helix transcriptional regulator [Ktedonobacteraceae bacterium]